MYKLLILSVLMSLNFIVPAQDLEYTKTFIKKMSSAEFKGRGYVEAGDKMFDQQRDVFFSLS